MTKKMRFVAGFNLLSNSLYLITLTATARIEATTGTESAKIDPLFTFDNPADALLYHFEFSPGVVNGDTPTTPLLGALPLFAAGLGVLGLLSRRRKQQQLLA